MYAIRSYYDAVMEKTRSGGMVPLQAGWNDLGSWEALWQVGAKDEHANVVHGDVLLCDVKNSFLHAGSRITSYNVCYTKLLRQNARSPDFR